MATEVLGLPRGRALTRADLEKMPDDGHRYELIDGVLIVTPSPIHVHQRGVGNLHVLLRQHCPDHLEVLLAPFDVALADDTVMQPDLIVAERESITWRDLPTAPVLAVEVLSRSTRNVDLLLKKERLQRAGCQHYWTVDPGYAGEPAITVWELRDGVFVEAASATGDDAVEIVEPFALRIVPSELVAR